MTIRAAEDEEGIQVMSQYKDKYMRSEVQLQRISDAQEVICNLKNYNAMILNVFFWKVVCQRVHILYYGMPALTNLVERYVQDPY